MKTLIGGIIVAALIWLAHFIVNAAADVMNGMPIAVQSLIVIAGFGALCFMFMQMAVND